MFTFFLQNMNLQLTFFFIYFSINLFIYLILMFLYHKGKFNEDYSFLKKFHAILLSISFLVKLLLLNALLTYYASVLNVFFEGVILLVFIWNAMQIYFMYNLILFSFYKLNYLERETLITWITVLILENYITLFVWTLCFILTLI
jgi:hypothetical protein